MEEAIVQDPGLDNSTAARELRHYTRQQLSSDFLTAVRKEAMKRFVGTPDDMNKLDDLAEQFKKKGHFFKIFRMSGEEMILHQLEIEAKECKDNNKPFDREECRKRCLNVM